MENWTIENFILVAQAMWKMAGFFWPLLLLITFFALVEWRKETRYGTN